MCQVFTISAMEVTPAEFARQAFVSRQSINGKIKNGTLIVNSAGKLDTDNPLNRSYLEKHRNKLQQDAATEAFLQKQRAEIASNAEKSAEALIETIQSSNGISAAEMQNMTLGEIVRKFGNMEGVDRFVKLQKDLVTIEEKNQRLQEKRLQLLPRDFVIARLFGFQQQQASRVLDVPESGSDQIIAMVLANPDGCRQKIIEYMRDLLSRAIGGAKEHVVNELSSLRAKYDDNSDSLSEKIDALMEATQ